MSRSSIVFFLGIFLSLAVHSTEHHVPQNWNNPPDTSPTTTTAASDPSTPSPTDTTLDSTTSTATGSTSTSAGTPSAGGTYTGDITHYEVGLGSCGYTNTDSEAVCALSVAMMANGANPNTNPKCGTFITLVNPTTGSHTQAKVVDTCQACAYEDVDLSPTLFVTVAPTGNGRVHGIEWSFDS